MIVIESGFGDTDEAFLEKRYTPGVNVIYSNDNNRGKTLVLQGLMYSIGNDPIFPEGFGYRKYYFYSRLIIGSRSWRFLRKENSFVVLGEDSYFVADSVSQLKRYIDANIFPIPKYSRNGATKISELSLFYQIFFLPQDSRDTSSVIGGGYYNKNDFYQMMYSITNEEDNFMPPDIDVKFLTEEITQLKRDIVDQKKMLTFAKKRPEISAIANSNVDRALYYEKKSRLEKIHSRISEEKKRRARETSMKIKLERLDSELRSLNRTIRTGSVECGDCHSRNIIFKNVEFAFDVSNDYVRKNILSSIAAEISLKQEVIDEISRNIENDQKLISIELAETPKSIQVMMFSYEEILSDSNIQISLDRMENELKEKQEMLDRTKSIGASNKANGKSLIDRIVNLMQSIYLELDPSGKLKFTDIFSKRGVVYSGSEGMEFYLAKLLSIKIQVAHSFPIIIDSFRDGELSTDKEKIALNALKKAAPQAILTSTVKKEEYAVNIYKHDAEINAIDYSEMSPSKILSKEFVSEFKTILRMFSILL
jgi:hypothetical protein